MFQSVMIYEYNIAISATGTSFSYGIFEVQLGDICLMSLEGGYWGPGRDWSLLGDGGGGGWFPIQGLLSCSGGQDLSLYFPYPFISQ